MHRAPAASQPRHYRQQHLHQPQLLTCRHHPEELCRVLRHCARLPSLVHVAAAQEYRREWQSMSELRPAQPRLARSSARGALTASRRRRSPQCALLALELEAYQAARVLRSSATCAVSADTELRERVRMDSAALAIDTDEVWRPLLRLTTPHRRGTRGAGSKGGGIQGSVLECPLSPSSRAESAARCTVSTI